MSQDPRDPPLEVFPPGGMLHPEVIDLADMRIRLGRTPIKATKCEHRHVLYSTSERRVWCEDCERTIDAFDALMTVSRYFEKMVGDLRRRHAAVRAAEEAALVSRAAKAVDRVWRGHRMAPCCPHCSGALLPEDFASGPRMETSREIEVARRKRDGEPQGRRR